MYRISEDHNWNLALNAWIDPTVSEIVANGPGSFFLKRKGRREAIEGIAINTAKEYFDSVTNGLVPLVESMSEFDPTSFIYEGPLSIEVGGEKYTGRCTIILPPASDVPQIALTKRSKALVQLDDITEKGSLAPEMASFLKDAVKANLTIVLSGATGAGKDLHVDTLIPTTEGMKTVGEIKEGDILFDETGKRTNLLKKYRPMDKVHYKMTLSNNVEIKAGTGHLWPVTILDGTRKGEKVNLTTNEIVNYGVIINGNPSFAIEGLSSPVDFEKASQIIEPNLKSVMTLLSDKAGKVLESAGIEESYKTASTYQRQALLEGALGVVGRKTSTIGEYELSFNSEILCKDFKEVAASLGWKITGVESVDNKYSFRTYPELPKFDKLQSLDKKHYILSVEEIDDNPEDYYCFMVDSPSRLFLCTENYIPTHNTTMLQALTKLIPLTTRIGVAEDVPELELDQPDTAYLKSQPPRPGLDPKDVAPLSWVVKQFNRIRTDKVIVGETRGEEFAEFLVAANSGQEGSITTIHAETPKRCLEKMSLFALKGSGTQPLRAVNIDIAQTVDLIIQLIILPDGRHRMASITSVSNTVSDGDEARITTAEIYAYDKSDDSFYKKGTMPDALREKLTNRGVDITKYITTPVGEKLTGTVQTNKVQPQSQKGFFGRRQGIPTMPGANTDDERRNRIL